MRYNSRCDYSDYRQSHNSHTQPAKLLWRENYSEFEYTFSLSRIISLYTIENSKNTFPILEVAQILMLVSVPIIPKILNVPIK